jgi:asparagine synthase (glutamine-hydrolysing)
VEAVPPSEKKVTISFLLKRFVQGADLEGVARHQLWVSNIAPPLLQRLGVTPVNLENHDTGRRPFARPGAVVGFGDAAG